ncbi:MAG TPA: helix-turn-helix domain-containing protein [Dehalococcoidia bacterium]|jgi:cytoskeletal protein RodZ
MPPSPLGETLRRARTAKGITIEDAERVTRIPRKYLEALELDNFGILPAPVYARGFLRSYAGYLGLEPGELLPFFPVGHVDEPTLDPLPEVDEPRTWNLNGIVAMAVVGLLVLLVIGLYSLGHDSSNAFSRSNPNTSPIVVGAGDQSSSGQNNGVAAALPDLVGQTQQQAISLIRATGADYIIVGVQQNGTPAGQVVSQDPPYGHNVGPGDLVTINVSQ